MLGFPVTPTIEPEPIPVVPAPRASYDVVVVGAGAGGGVSACVLAEAGLRVLLIERARRAQRRPSCATTTCTASARSSTTRSPGPDRGIRAWSTAARRGVV